MEPRRECAIGLEVPERGPSRISSLGIAAASYMSSLMLILVSVNEDWRLLGVFAGSAMERVWRPCGDADMEAASLDGSSCNGSVVSDATPSGEGGAVDSSGDSANADSNSGSVKLSVWGRISEAITTR
jgi:hypothetical protein